MYEHMPNVNAIIHTHHSALATAVGFVTDELPEFLVTVIDACHNPVKVALLLPLPRISAWVSLAVNTPETPWR